MIAALARFVTAWPRAVVAVAALISAVGAWLGAFHLRIDSNTDSLIAEDRPFMRDYRAFLAEFGDIEGAIVVVDPRGDDAAARRAVDAIAAALAPLSEQGAVGRVSARIDPHEQWRLASWAASDAELAALVAATPALVAIAEGREKDHPLVADELSKQREPEYLRAPDGKFLLVEVMPAKDFTALEPFAPSIAAIRAALEPVRAAHAEVEIGLTGMPVLQADEMATANRDMTRASIASLAIISVLFFIVFRGFRRPLLAVIAFAIACGWAYGAATLMVGRLTLLSVVFMLVLVGAGLDYGVHVVSRYGELRRSRPRIDAVREALVSVGPGTISGAVGSAAVFFLALFADFGGLRELGVVAGTGLLLCALAMVTVLPALLAIAGDGRGGPEPREALPVSVARPRIPTLAAACLPLLLLAVAAVVGPVFDLNLLNLQSPRIESVEWEKRLMVDSAGATLYAVSTADSLEAVAQLESRARDERAISRTESVLSVIKPESEARRALRQTLAQSAPASYATDAASPAAAAAREILAGAALSLRDALPAAVRDRMVSPRGTYLVQYFAASDAWIPRELGRFIARVRAVDARATGVPFTQHGSIDDMLDASVKVSLLSLVAIAIVACIDLRSIALALLAVGTVVAGVGMTLGAMPLLGIPLNLANFFAIPMLIGLSVDSAIHLIHRAKQDPTRLSETVRAVGFTALTTAIGFGALVFAEHRGMQSLGAVMLVGSLLCMYAACVILPLVLRLLTHGQYSSAASADTNSGSTPSGSADMKRLP